MELRYSSTNRAIFGEVQLKDGSECFAPGPDPLTRSNIALVSVKFTTATLTVRKRRKCKKTPTIEEPDYIAGLVGGDRIFFRSKRLPENGYILALIE